MVGQEFLTFRQQKRHIPISAAKFLQPERKDRLYLNYPQQKGPEIFRAFLPNL
jgi:hypothetical protein